MSLNLSTQANVRAQSRLPGPADGVLGLLPEIVLEPGNLEEVAEVLAWANREGLKVVPRGAGTKLDRGAPPNGCDILLDLRRLNRVLEHASGDLTVTVEAGVTLPDLQRQLASAGQFLAVDPPVPGTVGGMIAIADTGPRRLRYGGVRDLILGVTFVRADGVIAKAGGKVVKNVAGYDLPKLLTGSLGTLGVVIEATFRLYPLPAASATVVADVALTDLRQCIGSLMQSTVVPTSIDYFFEPETSPVLAVRFESTQSSVQAQGGVAAQLLGTSSQIVRGEAEQTLWSRFEAVTATGPGDVLARLVATVSDLPGLLDKASMSAQADGVELTARAHVGHGHALLRWHAPATDTDVSLLKSLRSQAEAMEHNLVIWRAPHEVRSRIDVWGDPGEGFDLMRRVKQQFDPNTTLNPGRFVGGI